MRKVYLESFRLSQCMQSSQAETSDSFQGMSSWTVISDNLAIMENLALSCRRERYVVFGLSLPIRFVR